MKAVEMVESVDIGVIQDNVFISEVDHTNITRELKELYESLGSRYKKMIDDYPTRYTINLNTTRKWFYLGICSSNYWFREQESMFLGIDRLVDLKMRCNFNNRKKTIDKRLMQFRIDIGRELESLGVTSHSFQLFLDEVDY